MNWFKRAQIQPQGQNDAQRLTTIITSMLQEAADGVGMPAVDERLSVVPGFLNPQVLLPALDMAVRAANYANGGVYGLNPLQQHIVQQIQGLTQNTPQQQQEMINGTLTDPGLAEGLGGTPVEGAVSPAAV